METFKILEIICSVSAVISIYCYGNGSWYAPLIGLFSQIFWVWWSIVGSFESMIFLCLAMVITHFINIKKLQTIQKLKQILWK